MIMIHSLFFMANNPFTGRAPKPTQSHNTRGVRSGAMDVRHFF
jgi:hypothetical protein